MLKHPGHFTSMKKELGACTKRLSLCFDASTEGSGCSRSTSYGDWVGLCAQSGGGQHKRAAGEAVLVSPPRRALPSQPGRPAPLPRMQLRLQVAPARGANRGGGSRLCAGFCEGAMRDGRTCWARFRLPSPSAARRV